MDVSKFVRNVSLMLLVSLTAGVIWIAFATYNPDPQGRSSVFLLLVKYHIFLMAGMVVVSLAVGIVLSHFYHSQLQRRKRDSSSMLHVILRFLGQEEQKIISFLVSEGGESTQSEIARLPRMGRVKAHRALKKMEEKRIVEVTPHGKVRRVRLKPEILATLRESP